MEQKLSNEEIARAFAMYLGCLNGIGHYLFAEGCDYSSDAVIKNMFENTGINIKVLNLLDGSIAPDTTPWQQQGLYSESIIQDKLRVISWWDRTVDKRMGSNSSLIGIGYMSGEEMLDDAVIKFPSVMKRQERPIKFVR